VTLREESEREEGEVEQETWSLGKLAALCGRLVGQGELSVHAVVVI
jgi:hypothetical protein